VSISVRGIPWSAVLFLAYAVVILAGIGISLGGVVEQAVLVPITPLGLLDMALLAYTIFTTTLFLQRKEAARSLALGLASLTVPAIPLVLLAGYPLPAVLVAVFAFVLIRGLRSAAVARWLDQP
jgi:hypothetical protein